MEIAYDLATGGAARVRLAVRTPPNILVRSPAGPFFARTSSRRLPPARADAIARQGAPQGARRPHGVRAADPRGGRVQPAASPRRGARRSSTGSGSRRSTTGGSTVVAGVEALDEAGVILADGERIAPDAVIAATGYRRGLEPLVGHLDVLDEHGAPLALRARRRRPDCASSATSRGRRCSGTSAPRRAPPRRGSRPSCARRGGCRRPGRGGSPPARRAEGAGAGRGLPSVGVVW